MHITQNVGIAHTMTPAAVNVALKNSGFDDNSAVAVVQHENLVLFKDEVNSDYHVTEVQFELRPIPGNVQPNGGNLMITNQILATYNHPTITYSYECAYNDTTDLYPEDIMAPIKIDDLEYVDAFMIALGQTQPDILMSDEYTTMGVCIERNMVLMQFENRFYEYGFKVLHNEDGIHGTVMIQGLPSRVWDK
jgi:hypothetical protein